MANFKEVIQRLSGINENVNEELGTSKNVIVAKKERAGGWIGNKVTKKVGDFVKLSHLEGKPMEWGLSPADFNKLKSYVGQRAEVIKQNSYYLDLRFKDGFIAKNINDHQVK